MSTTGANADPLAALGALPGVAESVESVRKAVDRVYGHRIMRRRSNEITGEAALRGARGSAALSGADWALEEVPDNVLVVESDRERRSLARNRPDGHR
ncbi:hypothetical protein ACWDVV_35695, partial [Streptomyces tendae]